MANIKAVRIENLAKGAAEIWEWVLAVGDVGLPILIPGESDQTVHVYGGTFTGGGAISLNGSLENDPATAANFAALRDPQGGLIVFDGTPHPDIAAVLENVATMQAVRAVGTGDPVTVRVMVV